MATKNREQAVTESARCLVVHCELCGEPVKLINVTEEGWFGGCSDPRCGVLHQGSSTESDAIPCAACDQPVKFVGIDDDGWVGQCSDPRCGVLHQDVF